MPRAIADTGPLVAFLDRSERHHRWVSQRVAELEAPLLICEPVLAEAMFLLARASRAGRTPGAAGDGALRLALRVEEHVTELRTLHHKYRDKPMSLADVCIVRMAELYKRHAVLTLNSDFMIYRKHGGGNLSLIRPNVD
jgi:predicted nucleic acid-binding protein